MKYTYAELHFHTKESSHCGEISAYDSIPMYKEHGYDLVCVTDHYNREYFFDYLHNGQPWEEAVDQWFAGWYAARDAGKKCGVKVLHAAEFRFDESFADYLVFGMTDEMFYEFPALFLMTSAEFSVFAREHGLFFAQAHPYRNDFICDPAYLDGVEIYNFHPDQQSHNELAVEWAKANNLIPLCGQDFHCAAALQDCKTRFHGEVDDIPTLISKLRARDYDLQLPDGSIITAKDF